MAQFSTYEFDYFSGSQVGVYIGDTLIDDIASIRFNVTQSRRPVYGYASQYFHSVSAGQVLVEGDFIIPFREPNYLLATLINYGRKSDPKIRAQLKYENEKGVSQDYLESFFYAGKARMSMLGLSNALKSVNNQQWVDVKAQMEKMIYENQTVYDKPNMTSSEGNSYEALNTYRRADQYPPFDIYITYGDPTSKYAPNTLRKILGVHIVGQGQGIEVGGQPVAEQYSFIARNLA
jgi:hypothetical protein